MFWRWAVGVHSLEETMIQPMVDAVLNGDSVSQSLDELNLQHT